MRRAITFLGAVMTASSMLVAPSFASTDTGAYNQHQSDCLKLLFTDPAAHEAQCGGPFTVPPTSIPTSGSGAGCPRVTAEIAPLDLPGVVTRDDSAVLRIAGPGPCSLPCPITWKHWSDPDAMLEPQVLLVDTFTCPD